MKKILKTLLIPASTITLPISLLSLGSCQKITPTIESIVGSSQLEVGQTSTYVAIISPESADQSVTWSIDNEEVASINEEGKLYALSVGEARITATLNTDPSVTATRTVTVVPMTTQEIEIVGDESIHLYEEGKDQLQYKAEFTPKEIHDTVTWTLDTTDIATIDSETGVLTPLSDGYVQITATSNSKPEVYGTLILHIEQPIAKDWDTDDWRIVCYYANQGIDILHEKYEDEWEKSAPEEGKIENSFVGSTKAIQYTTDNVDVTCHARVIGQDCDELVDPYMSNNAALTFQMVELLPSENGESEALAYQWNENHWYDSYNNSWFVQEDWDCELRGFIRNSVLPTISKGLGFSVENTPIKNIKRKTALGNKLDKIVSSNENVFVLGVSDIFSTMAIRNASWNPEEAEEPPLSSKANVYMGEGSQYEFYQMAIGNMYPEDADGNEWLVKSAPKTGTSDPESYSYWLRTPFVREESTSDLSMCALAIGEDGVLSTIDLQEQAEPLQPGFTPKEGIAICFCI